MTNEWLHLQAITEAQINHRPHSLINTRRFWQYLVTSHNVAGWGYAYQNGSFNA